ncbi:MAG: hypothetical protein H8E13_04035 [Actinobacteria bacterium]|nr:hypothetical protein [Actinomycetota bacterium]
MKHPAINYPVFEGDVKPYLQNIYDKLFGGLDAKYGIAAGDVAAILTHITDIDASIIKSVADHETAQASTLDKNNKLHNAKEFTLKLLHGIQDHDDFEELDAEDLGMRVYKEPVDLNTVKPEVTKITLLPEKVIFDWAKGSLDGVIVKGSYNGIDYTEIGKYNHSPFEDTRSNVTDGPETRYYIFRYFKGDLPVGLETDPIKVICTIA